MSGGGSGGSGTQKYEWNDELKPYWKEALVRAGDVANKPYQQYTGQRIADLSPQQQQAAHAVQDWANIGGTGPAIAGKNQAEKTLNGNYLFGSEAANPFANATNPYSGFGPQFNDALHAGEQDITNAYNQGTAADTTRMFNLAGAFGGSAHQTAMANNQSALAKQLANYDAQMRNDQYNRSAALQEQQFGRGMTGFENERNRMTGMVPMGFEADNQFIRNNQALMGIGDMIRGYNQDVMNLGYQDFQDQQNYPAKMVDYLTGIMSRAQGGVSPNVTTQNPGYAASPYSQLLGAGLLAYGMR